jgi:hypothetical protein
MGEPPRGIADEREELGLEDVVLAYMGGGSVAAPILGAIS